MIPLRTLFLPACSLIALLFSNCANVSQQPKLDANGNPVNPHPPGTYEHFKAESSYPKTFSVWKNEELLSRTNASNSHILIDLSKQRGMLMNDGEVAMDYPICSGVPSRPTPKGTFFILEKIVDKSSNKYGRIYDAEGNLVNGDADSTQDPVPEGGKFVGAPMRYWMRLTNDGVGHHIGPLPRSRRPASHACVRGPSKTMPLVYSKVKVGTRVEIQ